MGDGNPVPVALTASGSLNVVAGQVYGLDLFLTAGGDQPSPSASAQQSANFSNTAQFAFTNLDGLTVSSSSGKFLSAVSDSVSTAETGTLPLLMLGLMAMVIAATSLKSRIA